MIDVIYTIIGLVIGASLVLAFSRSARQKTVGICEVVLGQSAKKRENKEKILALLGERARSNLSGQGELGNSDIREALGVSPRTIVDYMDPVRSSSQKKFRIKFFLLCNNGA